MHFLFVGAAILALVNADIYFQNPRGSNNRLKGRRRERDNANRLFDSQNNDRGGYNVGRMYYYTGSTLSIEWTNQHSCGGDNNNCDLVIQMMCSENLRDGTEERTIPDDRNQCVNRDCNTDFRYGMHEDYEYYDNCNHRRQNNLLFTADQNVRQNTARFTRQNPEGTRRGYECAEERDYYPYWSPTPWKDIVVMTNDEARCEYYKRESENVKPRFHCFHRNFEQTLADPKRNKRVALPRIPITQVECERFEFPKDSAVYGVWIPSPSHGLPPPDCIASPQSRDNHLGNGETGYPNTYNWTIPNIPHDSCALRIRYNISTNDYPESTNFDSNGSPAPIIDIGKLVGLSKTEAKERGYVFKNDPQVQPLKAAFGDKLKLALAINTAQLGRTFEDRSHSFAIRTAPEDMAGSTIHNLNVRGKRGNIVQTYPATEYDFVPNKIVANVGEYIHIQWTGSDDNPNNNAGEGRAGTDRSNIVLLDNPRYVQGNPDFSEYGFSGRSYPMQIKEATFLGLPEHDMVSLAILRMGDFSVQRVNPTLDEAGTYFNLGPRKITQSGTYNYMCTRNNNFSNRSQKGKIIVNEKDETKKKDTNNVSDDTTAKDTKSEVKDDSDLMFKRYVEYHKQANQLKDMEEKNAVKAHAQILPYDQINDESQQADIRMADMFDSEETQDETKDEETSLPYDQMVEMFNSEETQDEYDLSNLTNDILDKPADENEAEDINEEFNAFESN